MKKFGNLVVAALIIATISTDSARAEQDDMTVAVLNFDSRDKSLADSADLIRQLIEVGIGGEAGLALVSRTELDKILEEQKRGLSGLGDTALPSVGKLLGAAAMVTGSVFKVQEQVFVTAKIFSTETGRSFATKAKGSPDDLETMADSLSREIGAIVEGNRAEFRSPVVISKDELDHLRNDLSGKTLPVVFVSFDEQTIGVPAIDPAIQTEYEYILRQCGFEVLKDQSGDLRKWMQEYRRGDAAAAPPQAEGIDIIIHGEGISEFATRNADLVSFRSRVETEALDVKTGKVLTADRETVTSVDLSSHIAAKSALQKAAAILAHRTLAETVAEWNAIHSNTP